MRRERVGVEASGLEMDVMRLRSCGRIKRQ